MFVIHCGSECNATKAEKLVEDWVSYAILVGCEADNTRSYQEMKAKAWGYKRFILRGEEIGLSEEHISDCWDLVQLQLIAIRSRPCRGI